MQVGDLQTGIFAALLASADVTNLVGARIFDHTPEAVDYPHVVIGETDTNDWSLKASEGQEHIITLHIWSRERGKSQAHAICTAIHQALHNQALSLSAQQLIKLRTQRTNVFTDADGITMHGVMDFLAWTTEI